MKHKDFLKTSDFKSVPNMILDKITAIFMQSDEFNANQCVDDMFECFLAFTKKHITSVLAI